MGAGGHLLGQASQLHPATRSSPARVGTLVCEGFRIKYHGLCGLKNKKFFSHNSGGQKSKTKSVWRVSFLRSFFPWLAGGYLLLHVCLCGPPSVCVCVPASSPYKDTGHTGLGPNPYDLTYP